MNYRTQINQLLADHRAATSMIKLERKALIKAEDDLTDASEAQEVLQHVAQAVQQSVHDKLAGVVSRCLEAVFDEPYKFHIEFVRKRGRTEADLTFRRNGLHINPLKASGGGVVDMASFALRLACLMLTKPPVRRLLVLDEPFRFLSREYRPRVRQLLEKLAKEMDLQIIMVTHINELRCGKVVELA